MTASRRAYFNSIQERSFLPEPPESGTGKAGNSEFSFYQKTANRG